MPRAVGIEAINVHAGTAKLDVRALCEHRGLDTARFDNLMMNEKTVALPYEDPVSFAINAALPIIDALTPEQRSRIEMVVTCTESGIDFGKSMSTYLHHYLELPSNCRLFEIKQACYSGTAGLQMAANFILSGTSSGAKALVVATDISRFALADSSAIQEWAYSEPSSGSGAVALLIGEEPEVFAIDVGAYGNHGFEVMDTCRPGPDTEAGDADLSLMAYLDCVENAFKDYQRRVEGADFRETFDALSFHTPFGGMVKGAHRQIMRRQHKAAPPDIEADFQARLAPSLTFSSLIGNTAGASVFVGLASLCSTAEFDGPKRIGLFSYGSGCCSEFFSGVVPSSGAKRVQAMGLRTALDARHSLSIEDYEKLLAAEDVVRFGTRDAKIERDILKRPQRSDSAPGDAPGDVPGGGGRWLVLDEVKGYHRIYRWA